MVAGTQGGSQEERWVLHHGGASGPQNLLNPTFCPEGLGGPGGCGLLAAPRQVFLKDRNRLKPSRPKPSLHEVGHCMVRQ